MASEDKSLKEAFPNYPKVKQEEIHALQLLIQKDVTEYGQKLTKLFDEAKARDNRYVRERRESDRPQSADAAIAIGMSLANHLVQVVHYQGWQDKLTDTLVKKLNKQEDTIGVLEKRLAELEKGKVNKKKPKSPTPPSK